MNTKIYQNKPKTIIHLAVTVLIIVGLAIYMLWYNTDPITSLTSLVILGFLIYAIYACTGLVIKVFKQNPIIIFSDYSVEVARNFKSECFLWSEIQDWRILYHADSKEIAFTIGGKQKFIQISDLKTTASEIRNIMETMLPGKEFIPKQ